MPDFVLNRNYTHRSTHGHIINFVKGEPVYIPPILVREVTAFGAEPVDGPRPDVLDAEQQAAEPAPAGDDLNILISAAFDTMQSRNQRGDYAANGRPSTKVLKEILGFEVTAAARDAVWEARNKAA